MVPLVNNPIIKVQLLNSSDIEIMPSCFPSFFLWLLFQRKTNTTNKWYDMIWCDMIWCDMIWCDMMTILWRRTVPWWPPCRWGSVGRSCSVVIWVCPPAPYPVSCQLWGRSCPLSVVFGNCLPIRTNAKLCVSSSIQSVSPTAECFPLELDANYVLACSLRLTWRHIRSRALNELYIYIKKN